MLDEHLALIAHRFIEGEAFEQLEAGQEQPKGHRLLDVAHAALGIEERQAHMRSICGDQAQTAPTGEADLLADQFEQRAIDSLEDIGPNLVACLGEGLGSDHAYQPGALREQGEEAIEFGLHGATHAREQEGQYGGKGQRATAGEELW